MGLNAKNFERPGGWLKKDDLRRTGAQLFLVASVEEREGKDWGDGKPVYPELVLVFTNGKRFPLRATVNLDRVRDGWGDDCTTWPGKTIEIYFSPDVPNPRGGEPGALRVRLPESVPAIPVKRVTVPLVELPEDDEVPI
jgi:hypothetical protein